MAKTNTNKTNEQTVIATETKEVAIPFKYDVLMTEHKTKSAVIRFLDSKGYKKGPIAKFMGIKYQFVRNVLITPVKKATA